MIENTKCPGLGGYPIIALKSQFDRALAYETPAGVGIGVLLVDDKSGLKKELLGYWKGKDCTVQKIVECPAVLVKGNVGSPVVGTTKTKYSTFLSNACREVTPAGCP